MRNVGLDKAQAGIKTAGKNINNLRYINETTLMAESDASFGMEWFCRASNIYNYPDHICDEFHWPSMGIVSGNHGITFLSNEKVFSL